MNPKIAEALRKSAAIPSMPQVVTRFLEIIQDPNFEYDAVVKVLSADAGTVSEILRLANSALFGVARRVTSLKQALTLLGPRRTRSLVLGRYLVEAMGDTTHGAIDTSYFWRRSLASAVIAARLADRLCPRSRDEVFLSALLADIGVTILAQAMPEEYTPLAARYAPYGTPVTDEEEIAAVETTHAHVSSMVLSDWALPDLLCTAVSYSHASTFDVEEAVEQAARIMNASDSVARLLCEIPDVTKCGDTCMEAMRFVRTDLDVLVGILGDVENDVAELASILKIDVIPGTVYSTIAEAIKERLAVAGDR